MGFNEKSHAFLAARFYVRLTEQFGERGRLAFVHGTQYYAGQRGRRMAQRAIRDGRELNYQTYQEYGEWVNTEEVKAMGCANQSELVTLAPDYQVKITRCPWHTQFAEMGLTEAGHEYCAHLDTAISRGFNPYIVYEVSKTLHKSDCCIHTVRNAGLEPGKSAPKKMEYVKPFSYHCAHSYYAYAEVAEAVFGAEGRQLAAAVLDDFEAEYGREMREGIEAHRETNFNMAD